MPKYKYFFLKIQQIETKKLAKSNDCASFFNDIVMIRNLHCAVYAGTVSHHGYLTYL